MRTSRRILVFSALGVLPRCGSGLRRPVQSTRGPRRAGEPVPAQPEERARLDQLAREDHADMTRQLGITRIRPGFNGRAAAGEPNAANYDPARPTPIRTGRTP